MGENGALNLYAFADNMPSSRFDPVGNQAEQIGIPISEGIINIIAPYVDDLLDDLLTPWVFKWFGPKECPPDEMLFIKRMSFFWTYEEHVRYVYPLDSRQQGTGSPDQKERTELKSRVALVNSVCRCPCSVTIGHIKSEEKTTEWIWLSGIPVGHWKAVLRGFAEKVRQKISWTDLSFNCSDI
jgi:hypothetical protein